MINNAKEKSENLGAINNSILKGKGNFAGYLGEEIVAHYIKADIVSNSEYNHDLLKNNQRIEVKTKRRTVEPQDHYDASVAYTSRHQSPDLYIFTSIQFKNGTPIKAWICGKKEPKEYFKRAIIVGVLVFFISNNIKGNDIFSNINNNLIGGRISNIDITPGPPDF